MRFLTFLLALSVLFAGCLDGDSDDDGDFGISSSGTSTTSSSSTSSSSSSGSTTSGSFSQGSNTTTYEPNEVPVIVNFVTSKTSGEVPVNLSVTWELSDADGDALSWTITANDEEVLTGTDLEGSAFLDFTEGGDTTLKMSVTDGKDTVSKSIVLELTDPPFVFEPITYTFTGDGPGACDPLLGTCPMGPLVHTFAVPEMASKVDFELVWDEPISLQDYDAYMFDAAGAPAGSSAQSTFPILGCGCSVESGSADVGSSIGDWRVEIDVFLVVSAPYTLTVTVS